MRRVKSVSPSQGPSPGAIVKHMGSADSLQPRREASRPSSVQGSLQRSVQSSVHESEILSAMADFALQFFRYKRGVKIAVVNYVM